MKRKRSRMGHACNGKPVQNDWSRSTFENSWLKGSKNGIAQRKYLEAFHFATDLKQLLGSFDVHFDGCFELFVEFDGGCRVEDDGHLRADGLHISRGYSESRQSNVTGYDQDFVKYFGFVLAQCLENLSVQMIVSNERFESTQLWIINAEKT